jgi:2-keto-4-pentenoate hydratase/2-oxohepta-3-ene-1,7-dioic acid hydratase in catechol pathway
MPRLVSYIDDGARERAGVEHGGEVLALPAGLSLPVLLSLGPRAISCLVEEAAARPAVGRMAELRLLPPVSNPGKIICLAGNYQEHIREGGGVEVDKSRSTPHLFIKPRACLAPPGATVVRSRMTDRLDYECELAIVIGRTARDIPEAEALAAIGGFTIANDVSSRRLLHDGRDREAPRTEREKFFDWLVGKWQDSSLPLGPAVVTLDEVGDGSGLRLTLDVNGERRQDGSTSQMIFSAPEIVSFVSRYTTLEPGDLICTGTCAGVAASSGRFLQPGDQVVGAIEKLGELRFAIG